MDYLRLTRELPSFRVLTLCYGSYTVPRQFDLRHVLDKLLNFHFK